VSGPNKRRGAAARRGSVLFRASARRLFCVTERRARQARLDSGQDVGGLCPPAGLRVGATREAPTGGIRRRGPADVTPRGRRAQRMAESRPTRAPPRPARRAKRRRPAERGTEDRRQQWSVTGGPRLYRPRPEARPAPGPPKGRVVRRVGRAPPNGEGSLEGGFGVALHLPAPSPTSESRLILGSADQNWSAERCCSVEAGARSA